MCQVSVQCVRCLFSVSGVCSVCQVSVQCVRCLFSVSGVCSVCHCSVSQETVSVCFYSVSGVYRSFISQVVCRVLIIVHRCPTVTG